MKVRLTAPAQQQAERMDRWWHTHRDASDLFARELASVLTRLEAQPDVGTIYVVRDGVSVRRVRLTKTRNHVYYEVDAIAAVVMVLAVWGAPRGRGPRL